MSLIGTSEQRLRRERAEGVSVAAARGLPETESRREAPGESRRRPLAGSPGRGPIAAGLRVRAAASRVTKCGSTAWRRGGATARGWGLGHPKPGWGAPLTPGAAVKGGNVYMLRRTAPTAHSLVSFARRLRSLRSRPDFPVRSILNLVSHRRQTDNSHCSWSLA